MSEPIERRKFLKTAAVLACGPLALGATDARLADGPVRVNVAALSATHKILTSYAAAIVEMRAISQKDAKDPRGWIFQANMHWTPRGEPVQSDDWNQCEHGTRWFCPWHRGYLYFFERIVRQLSGDSSFALPYWKWDDAASRSLPLPFRQDPGSALYDASRGINDGSELPGARIDHDLAGVMAQASFDNSASGELGFSLSMDQSPHGLVHVEIGGNMGTVPTAARDPIFFLHHTNVDRLWNRWLDDPAHANPGDEAWLKNKKEGAAKPFRFYDENKKLVELTTEEVLKMTAQASRYDDDKEERKPAPAQAILVRGPASTVTLASASKEVFELTNKPAEVRLALGTSGAKRLGRLLAVPPGREPASPRAKVFVIVEGLSVPTTDPAVHYYVYLKSAGQKADEPGEYIGTVHFFGRVEHGEHDAHGPVAKFDQKFDATSALDKLSGAGKQALDDLSVRMVPVVNGKSKDAAVLEKTAVKGISFERIVVQTVE